MSDNALLRKLAKLALDHPEHRKVLMPLIRQARQASAKEAAMDQWLVSVRVFDRNDRIQPKNVKVRARDEQEAMEKARKKYEAQGNLYGVDFARRVASVKEARGAWTSSA